MKTQDIWDAYFAGDHESVLTAGAGAAEAMHVAGLSLAALGRFDEASTLLTSSVRVFPNVDWYTNACVAFLEKGVAQFAKSFADDGCTLYHDVAYMHFNAGNVYSALGDFAAARKAFTEAVMIDYRNEKPNWEARMNRGNCARRMGDFHLALQDYDGVLECPNIDLAGVLRTRLNRAVTLGDLGNHEESLAELDKLASEGIINSAEMDFNRATLRLKLGDYEEGWKLYERRWDCPMATKDVALFQKPILPTLQEGIGKKVLFCHEQGFGDSIQFVRYAPILAAAGLDITILVPGPLVRLFAPLGFPVVISRDGLDYDYELPMLSAPRIMGTTLDTIPWEGPYLTVDEELVKAASLPDTGIYRSGLLKIGIVWAGQARDNMEMKMIDRRRSMDIACFDPILRKNADFFSLQFGERAHEFNSIEMSYKIRPVLEEGFDFLDTAAVIQNLDLVITVDTSTAHLAAALGKPVWLMSRFDGCWRWLKGRADSPWYLPNVRIFHQPYYQDWMSVTEEVAKALDSIIS